MTVPPAVLYGSSLIRVGDGGTEEKSGGRVEDVTILR